MTFDNSDDTGTRPNETVSKAAARLRSTGPPGQSAWIYFFAVNFSQCDDCQKLSGEGTFMEKMRKKKQAGFTLMEMLITVLILGVLAAIAGGVYLGYVKDAKTAEAKAHMASLFTALQGCAQISPGTACTTASQFGRVGATVGGVTADGRWTLDGGTLTISTVGVYTLSAPLTATPTAGATDLAGILVSMNYVNGASPPGTFTCTINGVASPC
jgi:type IV pilus assembly protein PilE